MPQATEQAEFYHNHALIWIAIIQISWSYLLVCQQELADFIVRYRQNQVTIRAFWQDK